MAFDDTCHVRHATVAEFDIAAYSLQIRWSRLFGESVNKVEELFADIRFNFHVVRGLNQVMYLFLDFWRFVEAVECMGYVMHDKCPAFFKTSVYREIPLSNGSRSHDSRLPVVNHARQLFGDRKEDG